MVGTKIKRNRPNATVLTTLFLFAFFMINGASVVKAGGYRGNYYDIPYADICNSPEMQEAFLRRYMTDQTTELRRLLLKYSGLPEAEKAALLAEPIIKELVFRNVRDPNAGSPKGCDTEWVQVIGVNSDMYLETFKPLGAIAIADNEAVSSVEQLGVMDRDLGAWRIIPVKVLDEIIKNEIYGQKNDRSYYVPVIISIEVDQPSNPRSGIYASINWGTLPLAGVDQFVPLLPYPGKNTSSLLQMVANMAIEVTRNESRAPDYQFPLREYPLRTEDDIRRFVVAKEAVENFRRRTINYVDYNTWRATRGGAVSFKVISPYLAEMTFENFSKEDCQLFLDTYFAWENPISPKPVFTQDYECKDEANRMSWNLIPQSPFYEESQPAGQKP